MPVEPNNLRALTSACRRRLSLAAVKDPVFVRVLDAAEIAEVHLFPGLAFLVRNCFLVLRPVRDLLLWRVLIYIYLNIKYFIVKYSN